jgi:hypothetical protein
VQVRIDGDFCNFRGASALSLIATVKADMPEPQLRGSHHQTINCIGRPKRRRDRRVRTADDGFFSPLFHASFHGAHKPARRPKHAAGAETLESRQALFAVVVFIDEFEFVLAEMEVL